MSDENYQSFLICVRKDRAYVYRNGLPLGIVVGGKFVRHKHTMKDGMQMPVEIPASLMSSVESVISAMKNDE